MKKAFNDETAAFLSYQKYYPTRKEWLAYFLIAAVVAATIIVGGAFLIEHFKQ